MEWGRDAHDAATREGAAAGSGVRADDSAPRRLAQQCRVPRVRAHIGGMLNKGDLHEIHEEGGERVRSGGGGAPLTLAKGFSFQSSDLGETRGQIGSESGSVKEWLWL